MTDTIDHKSVVLAKYPHAIAVNLNYWRVYHRWVIHPDSDNVFRFTLGGGPTEAEAWHNAWVHIHTAERGKAGRSEVGR